MDKGGGGEGGRGREAGFPGSAPEARGRGESLLQVMHMQMLKHWPAKFSLQWGNSDNNGTGLNPNMTLKDLSQIEILGTNNRPTAMLADVL